MDNSPYIMVRILRPEKIFRRLAAGSPLLKTLRLEVRTPHREVLLNNPKGADHKATLFLKEAQLSRLLCCRTDFQNALDTDLIRMTRVPRNIEKGLHRIFQFSHWPVFHIDYV